MARFGYLLGCLLWVFMVCPFGVCSVGAEGGACWGVRWGCLLVVLLLSRCYDGALCGWLFWRYVGCFSLWGVLMGSFEVAIVWLCCLLYDWGSLLGAFGISRLGLFEVVYVGVFCRGYVWIDICGL